MKEYKKVILLSSVAAFVLAGCSVKPEAIKPEVIKADVTKTMQMLEKVVQPVTKPISLDEAIQRAVDHNLNRRLDILTSVLAEQKIDIVAYEALPSLTTKAGYSHRDSLPASQSGLYDPETDSVTSVSDSYSISSNRIDKTSSVAFSWNILDFGVSYVRANQQANRFLIAKEKERKSVYNIKQEVRNAYYKAVSADELLKRLAPISSEAKKAFADSVKIKDLKIDSPIKSLTYQRELLEVIRSLNTLEENLMKSKTELSTLMGLKPGTQFELSEKIKEKYELPEIKISMEDLERLALENRPELQETRYQIKISQDEVRTSMLKMLPGINFDAGFNYSNSDYLANNNWVSYGGSITWNLMNLFNGPLNKKLAETQVELAKQQNLALSMAVVSQVHLAMLDLAQAKKEYQLSEVYYGIAKEIYNLIENENALDVNGKLSLIKEKLNYLISNLRLSSSYAKVQNAYGKVISSVGNDEVFNAEKVVEKVEEKKPELVVVEEETQPEPTPVVVEEPKVEEPVVEVKPEPVVETPTPVVEEVKPELAEVKVEEVQPEPVAIKEEIIPEPTPVVVEEPKVEEPVVEVKPEPVVETPTPVVEEVKPELAEVKVEEVQPEPVAIKEEIIPEPTPVVVEEPKVEEPVVEVKPEPVVETPTPVVEEVKPELAEVKVEEVQPEPVAIKEEIIPEPTPVVVEEPKVEEPVVEEVKASSYDETKPTIEIKSNAKLVNLTPNGYEEIRIIKAGTKLNYIKKIYSGKDNYWYEVEGGFIHENRAIEIK